MLLSEIEPYRAYDPAASWTHIKQTLHIPRYHLTFVTQGEGGALSLVLVGSPACQIVVTQCLRAGGSSPCLVHPSFFPSGGVAGDKRKEFTLLIRDTA